MKTPSLLLGASLLFWGWQIGLLPLAMIMALVLEGSRLIKSRIDLSSSDFKRISDLCTLLFFGMFIYFFASTRSVKAVLILLQWLPLTLMPLLIAQVYSTSDRIDISAFFMIVRRRKAKQEDYHPTTINLTYPYFGLCVLSASAANMKTPWFYLGLFALSAWALWFARSKRFSPFLWISLLVLAGASGYTGHLGLHNLQTILEQKFTGSLRKDADPYRANTAIGDIMSLKLSDRILFRVTPEPGIRQPILLREASYDVYKSSRWFATHANFKEVSPDKDSTTWQLPAGSDAGRTVTVSARLRNGKGVLSLPTGAFEVANLPVLKMTRNRFAAVRVEGGPGLSTYDVRFNPDASFDSPPRETDLRVPPKERPAISKIVQELELSTQPPQKVLKRVQAFFQKNFNYSLNLNISGQESTPIGDFLLQSRSGHCEYFAAATVLLLRGAGIPARYATGYSVQEFSSMEKLFVVRERHAHAWVLVHVDGTWHDFDTTPSSWVNIEDESASMFEPIYDLWSWGMFKFSQWRWREREEGKGMTKYLWWLFIPLILLLAKRFYSRKRVQRPNTGQEETNRVRVKPGADSEFYLIEKRLNELGHFRHPWESLSDWFRRIERAKPLSISTRPLHLILSVHYRYRFDPKGISMAEKAELKSNVQVWLKECENIR